MFFDKAFGGLGGGGPAALTSPQMNPQSLAALMAMQNNSMAPALPAPPKPPAMGAPSPALQGPAPPPKQPDLMQMLMGMPPDRLKQMLGMLGIGGLGGAPISGSGMPGAGPGPGTGGLY